MFSIHRKELTWGGRQLVIETGRLARQADGAVLVTYGETTVLCTAVAEKTPRPGIDFFPLTVNYQEKAFAAGRIPGGFFKREGRPSEKETLTSRLIDRPIRPLFASGFRNETQVICTVLSHDLENDPDIPSLVGASVALTISGIPFLGPIFGARVGYVAGEYVLNPRIEELENSTLDMVVAGTADAVLMVESEAQSLSEEEMLGAVMFAQRESGPVIDAIIALAEECAKEPWALDPADPAQAELEEKIREISEAALRDAYAEQVKQARVEKVAQAKAGAQEALADSYPTDAVAGALKTLERTSSATQFSTPARASTAATPGPSARSGPRSESFPACTAAPCSPAARPRLSWWRPWARGRTSRSSTRSRANIASISCCTTTSRPTRWARRASCVRRGGARSATASSPGARCTR